ncbi:MAG: hypothetical protein PWP23_2787 [Candidatus Sumerlaeota bacterium]|nr:hypothetical protein [Candidatus Sumerlaeota bacterium]
MNRLSRLLLIPALLALLIPAGCKSATAPAGREARTVRVAFFNIERLSTEKITATDDTSAGTNEQLQAAAAIIQRIKPDILIVQELDHDYEALERGEGQLDKNLWLFETNYLDQGTNAVRFRHAFVAPCNTGLLAGHDFDNNGMVATEADLNTREYGGDTYGYGEYPGQFSMGILTNYPIDRDDVRTFQKFLWKDLPGAHLPEGWYSPEELEVFRLSSKSHWDIPIEIDTQMLHLLVSHPTPPVFDGPEDRNGLRNYDEIKFWAHYLDGDQALYDDEGERGGLKSGAPFIIAGDLNASPNSDPIATGEVAITQLLEHPMIADPGDLLSSTGALRGNVAGPPAYFERATASWREGFRVDYLLPGTNVRVVDGGVFWPSEAEDPEGAALADKASDHRLVWLDIAF